MKCVDQFKEIHIRFSSKEINELLIITLGFFFYFSSSLVCIYLLTVIGSNHTLCFSFAILILSFVVELLLNTEIRSMYVPRYACLHIFNSHMV